MDPPWLFCRNLVAGENPLDDAESRHAVGSLRLRRGAAVVLFDGAGRTGVGRLMPGKSGRAGRRPRVGQSGADSGSGVRVVVETVDQSSPPRRTLTLVVAACKGPRLDFLVEKCTELGVTRLVFAEFARSVVHLHRPHVDKLRRTAVEACKQCGRAWLPEIEAGASLGEVRPHTDEAALLIAHPCPEAAALGLWLQQVGEAARNIVVVIGPEGGLTEDEIGFLRGAGGQVVRLGEHSLRVETAAIAVSAAWATAAAPE